MAPPFLSGRHPHFLFMAGKALRGLAPALVSLLIADSTSPPPAPRPQILTVSHMGHESAKSLSAFGPFPRLIPLPLCWILSY